MLSTLVPCPCASPPFDAEPLGQANCVIVHDEVLAYARGANGTVWVSRDRGVSRLAAKSSGAVSDLYALRLPDDPAPTAEASAPFLHQIAANGQDGLLVTFW